MSDDNAVIHLAQLAVVGAIVVYALWRSDGFTRAVVCLSLTISAVLHVYADTFAGTALCWLTLGWLIGFSTRPNQNDAAARSHGGERRGHGCQEVE